MLMLLMLRQTQKNEVTENVRGKKQCRRTRACTVFLNSFLCNTHACNNAAVHSVVGVHVQAAQTVVVISVCTL